jgi:hypothetical protein
MDIHKIRQANNCSWIHQSTSSAESSSSGQKCQLAFDFNNFISLVSTSSQLESQSLENYWNTSNSAIQGKQLTYEGVADVVPLHWDCSIFSTSCTKSSIRSCICRSKLSSRSTLSFCKHFTLLMLTEVPTTKFFHPQLASVVGWQSPHWEPETCSQLRLFCNSAQSENNIWN